MSFSCPHLGCAYVAPNVGKRGSHARSMNSHSSHFATHKESCKECLSLIQSGEWTDIASLKAASFTSGFCTDADFPPTSVEVRAVARDPVVAGEQCSHVGCFWQSNAAKGHNKRASVQAHERSTHSHNDHFKSAGKTCCACQDLVKAGLWSCDKNGDLLGSVRPAKRKRSDSISVSHVLPLIDVPAPATPVFEWRTDAFPPSASLSPSTDSDWSLESRLPSDGMSDESDVAESSPKRRRLDSPSDSASAVAHTISLSDSDSEIELMNQFLKLLKSRGGHSRWAGTLRGLSEDLSAWNKTNSPHVDTCRRVLQTFA